MMVRKGGVWCAGPGEQNALTDLPPQGPLFTVSASCRYHPGLMVEGVGVGGDRFVRTNRQPTSNSINSRRIQLRLRCRFRFRFSRFSIFDFDFGYRNSICIILNREKKYHAFDFCINSDFYHCITVSLYHCITVSLYHCITVSTDK